MTPTRALPISPKPPAVLALVTAVVEAATAVDSWAEAAGSSSRQETHR